MKVMTRTLINMVLLLTASIIVQNAASAEVSARLQIPDGQTLLLSTKGVGYQIYTSEPKAGSTTEFEWKFKELVATLYGNSRKKIGKHYAGPTWEGNDGSKVVGRKIQEVPAPKAHDIPWLLIEATSHEGEGIFSKEGKEARVRYRATYIFLAPKQ